MVGSPITEDEVPRIRHNPWADNFFRPVLITIMITCITISVVNLVQLLNPAWRGTYFFLGMLLATVEGIYSYRLLRLRQLRGGTILRYRLGEMLVLMLVLKALSFANQSLPEVWAELQLIWQDPFNFINLEYYLLLVLSAMVWLAATNTMEDFEALHDPYTFYSDRILPLDSLAARFFWGGAILVVISGVSHWLARAGLSGLIDLRRPSLGGIIFNVLVYFVLGLVLLSQAHLARLLARWRIQRINVTSELVKQWARYGFIFLGLVGLVAFLLPTGYSMGLLTSAGWAIMWGMQFLMFILQLILFLLSLPLVWLLSLLGQELQMAPRQTLPPLEVPNYPPGGSAPPWLEVLRSLLFWLVLLAIAWYLLKIYFSDNPGLVQGLRQVKLMRFVLDLLAALWRRLAGLAEAGWDMIPKKVILTGQDGKLSRLSLRRWAGIASLSPRERILYYYLNTLERARQRGPARADSQTPYEFEPRLSGAIPEAEQEVNILTRAFVQARYSLETFDDTQAELARVLWQRIRQALSEREQDKSRDQE